MLFLYKLRALTIFVVTDEIDNVSNGESLPRKTVSKTNTPNAEINDEKVKPPSNVKR